jgi:hypothetical protein
VRRPYYCRAAIAAGLLIAAAASSCWDAGNPVQAGRTGTAVALVHGIVLGGHTHASGYCDPIPNCSACHGASLQGGASGQPACTSCHGTFWTSPDCGSKSTHSVYLGGIFHAANYCKPLANCVACHGANLQGGTGGQPACTSCHGERWNSPNCGQNNHTVNLGGVLHAANYCFPYQNCSACHGADLHGGPYGAPSCLKCHTQKNWQNCGTVQHTLNEDGVKHALNNCKPLDFCVQCHGADLRGGYNNEPSCYKCHGTKWTSSDCGR